MRCVELGYTRLTRATQMQAPMYTFNMIYVFKIDALNQRVLDYVSSTCNINTHSHNLNNVVGGCNIDWNHLSLKLSKWLTITYYIEV